MLVKNASQKIHVYAYDSTTGAAKVDDQANITAYVSLDGTANAIDDTNPAQVDSTNMPGIYAFDLTAAETNCDAFALYAKSTTSNIRLEPIIGFTTAGTATALAANAIQISGDSTAADNLEAAYDGAGYAGGTIKQQVDLASILASALSETVAGRLAAAFKKLLDVASPTGTLNSLPDAIPGAAGGVFIAGTNAPVTITGSGAALTISSTAANGSGLVVSGNGSGHGMLVTGGATGNGLRALGGATSGAGVYAASQGGTGGLNYAIVGLGNATGADTGGMYLSGGTTGGEGLELVGTGNGHGLMTVGAGTGEGIHATAGGGANAHGVHFEGVGANSSGMLLSRGGSGGDDLRFANNDVTVATVTTVGTVSGDVAGKVLGGGAGTITGTGVRAVDGSGNAIAPASTALLNTTWTDAKAGYLDVAISTRSSHDAAAVVTALGTGTTLTSLATATNLATVAGYIDTEITSILTIANKLDGMLVLDGAVYQFTANALELSPAGGGGTANLSTEITIVETD